MKKSMKQSECHKNLMSALENKNFNVFRRILKDSPDCINEKDGCGNTALMKAAVFGISTLFEELIARKANLDIKNNHGRTALIVMACDGYNESVDVLISAGADVSLKDKGGRTALKGAIKNGNKKCAESLIKAGSPLEGLSSDNLDKYGEIIKKHRPEEWSVIGKAKEEAKILSEKFSAYNMVNDFIVLKCEGNVPTLGKIHTMFNFRARTVTEVIGNNPGTPREFDRINPKDMDEIVTAYDFTVWKGKENTSPTKRPSVVKIPS